MAGASCEATKTPVTLTATHAHSRHRRTFDGSTGAIPALFTRIRGLRRFDDRRDGRANVFGVGGIGLDGEAAPPAAWMASTTSSALAGRGS